MAPIFSTIRVYQLKMGSTLAAEPMQFPIYKYSVPDQPLSKVENNYLIVQPLIKITRKPIFYPQNDVSIVSSLSRLY